MRVIFIPAIVCLASCTGGINYPEGGYEYPKQVADKDTNFYYYPMKDKLSRKDSFDYAADYKFWRAFNEPNLSLYPLPQEMFRLEYSGWGRSSYVIELMENKIIIKSGSPQAMYEPNESALTQTEKNCLQLLQRHFPLDGSQENKYLKKYIDSTIKANPQVLDPSYYQSLVDKSYTVRANGFKYSEVIIPIKKEKFKSFVEIFNASGFWSLPFNLKCTEYPMDGDGFELEANTKEKYNIVKVGGCSPGDTSQLAKACQNLVDYLHLEKEIRCYSRSNGVDSVKLVVKDVQLEEIKEPLHKKSRRHRSK